MLKSDDMIYNWSNQFRTSDNGERLAALTAAHSFRSKGFNPDETIEMLVGDQFNVKVAESATAEAFEYVPDIKVDETDIIGQAVKAYKNRDQQMTRVASKSVRQAFVTPTGYDEIAPVVEHSLEKYSAREFVDRLAKSEYPLLPTNNKSLNSWYRLASLAKDEPYALATLHSDLKPFLSDALLNSVLTAENPEIGLTIVAESEDGSKYVVASLTNSRKNTVNLSEGTCSCERYLGGNFNDFGLACEHVKYVSDFVSPHQRLARALKDIRVVEDDTLALAPSSSLYGRQSKQRVQRF